MLAASQDCNDGWLLKAEWEKWKGRVREVREKGLKE